MNQPLSAQLRTATAAAHENAEQSSFVAELMAGNACPRAFTLLSVQLLVVYRALEDIIAEHYADHPLVAPLDDRRLDRVRALEADLTHLVGEDFEEQIRDGRLPIVNATRAYVDVLRTHHDAEMMLANHYVRYLGDLSGGQIMARLVSRHYDVPADGLSFYRFPGIEKLKVYKDGYRAQLDSLPATDEQRDRLVQRAIESFELNQAVFFDLAAARAPQHVAAGVAP